MVPLVGLQYVIVTFSGHTHLLANIVFLKHDKIPPLAKKEPVIAEKTSIFKLKS